MRRARALVLVALAVVVATVAMGALALVRRPVLFHAFGEGDCACGDWHEKVTGLIVWNPLRDRAPERAAHEFLLNLRANRCLGNPECESAIAHNRISDWQLRFREDNAGVVALYFRLTKFGISDPRFNLTGEGVVGLRRTSAGWHVVDYSSYF